MVELDGPGHVSLGEKLRLIPGHGDPTVNLHDRPVSSAIGAPRRAVLRLVVEDAMRLVVIGIPAGTALAAVAARWSASLLYGLEPWDAATFVSAAILLLLVGAAAAYLPARRAVRIHPAVALRDE